MLDQDGSGVWLGFHTVKAPAAGVLLIDLENMIGQNARPDTLARCLDALLREAGSVPAIVAACADGRITPEGKQILLDRSIKLITVGGARHAADQALLEEARHLATGSHRRFVIASADGIFGKLADLGQLEIMLWKGQAPSKNAYTDRAVKVYRVARPKNAGPKKRKPAAAPNAPALVGQNIPAVTTTPPAIMTPRRPEALAAPDPLAERPAPDRSGARPAPPIPPRRADDVGVALLRGAAVFAAGTLFGAGTVVGAQVARHLLRSFER